MTTKKTGKKNTKLKTTTAPAVREAITPEVVKEVQNAERHSRKVAKTVDDLDPEAAADLLPQVQRRIRELTKAKEEIVAPMRQSMRAANSFFKKPLDAWEEIKAKLKEIIKKGVIAERKEQKKMLKEGAVEEAQTMSLIPARTRSVPRVKILDADAVPKKWKYEVVDEAALLEAKKDNPKLKVPGVKFWTETKVDAR